MQGLQAFLIEKFVQAGGQLRELPGKARGVDEVRLAGHGEELRRRGGGVGVEPGRRRAEAMRAPGVPLLREIIEPIDWATVKGVRE